jgi:hypothetical protein
MRRKSRRPAFGAGSTAHPKTYRYASTGRMTDVSSTGRQKHFFSISRSVAASKIDFANSFSSLRILLRQRVQLAGASDTPFRHSAIPTCRTSHH